jgi:hypothetical protein
MKGNIEIKITETEDLGSFPVTSKWIFQQDNTFENVTEWIDIFRCILLAKGFHPDTVEEYLPRD